MRIDEIERHRRTVTTGYGETSYLDVGAGAPALFVQCDRPGLRSASS